MATSHWPVKWSVFWLYSVCVFLWCMRNTYAIILNLYKEHENISQNHKNGQTTQTSNVKTARLLWVKHLYATLTESNIQPRIYPHFKHIYATLPESTPPFHYIHPFISSGAPRIYPIFTDSTPFFYNYISDAPRINPVVPESTPPSRVYPPLNIYMRLWPGGGQGCERTPPPPPQPTAQHISPICRSCFHHIGDQRRMYGHIFFLVVLLRRLMLH